MNFWKIALGIGCFLFMLGIGLFFIFNATGEDAFIALAAVSSQGVVWGVVAAVTWHIGTRGVRRLAQLKQDGRHFPAEIIRLNHAVGINVSLHAPTVYAECIYINTENQRCKVKSTLFLWENFSHKKLQANVYVDWNDPRRYAVEITRKEDAQVPVDIDYT